MAPAWGCSPRALDPQDLPRGSSTLVSCSVVSLLSDLFLVLCSLARCTFNSVMCHLLGNHQLPVSLTLLHGVGDVFVCNSLLPPPASGVCKRTELCRQRAVSAEQGERPCEAHGTLWSGPATAFRGVK